MLGLPQFGFGMLGFTLSLVLVSASCRVIAHYAVRSFEEKFWVIVASVALTLGTVAFSASLFSRLAPIPWLTIQFALYIVTFLCSRSSRTKFIPYLNARVHLRLSSLLLPLQPIRTFILCCVIGFIILSGLQQFLSPISGFDEKMYHASRVLYWIQNHSIFPYISHNDRQIVFPPGSELFFLWPILFTRVELIGRMFFWSAYPLSAIGLYLVLRELGASKNVSLIGVLTFVATPIITRSSIGLKPEMWLAVFVLGTAFWTIRACKYPDQFTKGLFFASLFLLMSVNVKLIALTMLPSLALLPCLAYSRRGVLSSIRSVLLGSITGLVLSGLVVTLAANFSNYGHILGPERFRKTHTSDLSLIQTYTHAVRLPFLLLEFPAVPGAKVREGMAMLGNTIISALGADQPLPLETDRGWPGYYVYSVPQLAKNFSLGGIIWLPLLVLALLRLIKELFRTYPNIHPEPSSILAAFEAPFLFGTVFLIRWMEHSQVPERFLVAPYALGTAVNMVLASKLIAGRRCFTVIAGVLLSVMVAIPLYMQLGRTLALISSSSTTAIADEPFGSALVRIPAGAHTLLVAQQNAPDYPLFRPRGGYSNQVTSWGKLPFDAARMKQLIEANHITHVLIQNDRELNFHWDPPVSTKEMVDWLSRQAGLREIRLLTKGMRLFEVTPEVKRRGLKTSTPLCSFTLSTGWYPLEKDGPNWWRWTAGHAEVRVMAEKALDLVMRGEIFSIRLPNKVTLLANGDKMAIVEVTIWDQSTKPLLVKLKAGENTIQLISRHPPTTTPNDKRLLAIALKNLSVTPSRDAVPCLFEP